MRKTKLLMAALALLVSAGVQAQSWTGSAVSDGLALLYNVGTGQYFSRGNGWNTQASISGVHGAIPVTLKHVSDGKYFICTNFSKDGCNNGEGYDGLENLGGTVYTDQSRNSLATWTFTEVDAENHIYNIISADNHSGGAGAYLTAEGGESTIVGPGADGLSDNAKWKIYSFADQKTKTLELMESASEASPVDATVLIDNPDFSSPALVGYWTVEASNKNLCGGSYTNHCAETYQNGGGKIYQTISVPNGTYVVKCQGFYRQDNGSDISYLYVNSEIPAPLCVCNANGENTAPSMDGASASFSAGYYQVDGVNVVVTDGSLTIGIQGQPGNWTCFDNFQLSYLGPLDMSSYNEMFATASALLTEDMSLDALQTLQAAMVDPSEVTDVSAALATLNEAIGVANTSIALYDSYQTAYDNAMALANDLVAAYGLVAYKTQFENKAAQMLALTQVDGKFVNDAAIERVIGQIGLAVAEANTIAAYCANVLSLRNTARTLLDYDIDLPEAKTALQGAIAAAAANMQTAESLDDIIAVVNGLNEAVGAYVESVGAVNGGPIDMTFTITNPSFETGNLTGWAVENSSDTGVKENSNGTYHIDNADGSYVFNIWPAGNPISQTITGLPNGLYKMTALIATDAGHQVLLTANDKSIAVNASEIGKTDGVDGEVYFVVEDGTATISAEGVDAYWYKVDNFRLTCINGSISIPVSEAGYATYCSPYALDFSNIEGLTAYTASMDGTTVAFTPFTSTIAAGNGLLIKGETADVPVVADGNVPDNAFIGVLEDTGVEPGVFVLLNGENGVGFYKTVNNFTVRANSAYLPALASGARFIALEGEATGIETVKAAEAAETIYNLAGQRVVKAQKGLYIQNGKKYMVK